MIQILLVEDQMIVRRGIISLLATIPDIEVIGEAADGKEALAKARSLQPQIVMDILLPKMTEIEVLNQLQQDPHSPPVLLLTTFAEDPLFLQAIQARARGFLLKDVSPSPFALSPLARRSFNQPSQNAWFELSSNVVTTLNTYPTQTPSPLVKPTSCVSSQRL